MIKPEIQRLFDRAEKLYEKGLITEEQYQDQMRNKEEILRRPSLGDYLREVIKLNFEDVKRTDCCTETTEWLLEKIEQWEKW